MKLHTASGVTTTCYCLHEQHKHSAQASDALNRVSGSHCSLRTPTSAHLLIGEDVAFGAHWPVDRPRAVRKSPGGRHTTSLSRASRGLSGRADPKMIIISCKVVHAGLREYEVSGGGWLRQPRAHRARAEWPRPYTEALTGPIFRTEACRVVQTRRPRPPWNTRRLGEG